MKSVGVRIDSETRITQPLLSLSPKKPPTKYEMVVATLLTDMRTPYMAAVASFVLTNSFMRKGIETEETIQLEKDARKTTTSTRIKFEDMTVGALVILSLQPFRLLIQQTFW